MRNFVVALLVVMLSTGVLSAQDKSFNHFDIGVGMGLNYGGFGWSVAYAPIPFLSIEGNVGYNIVEPVGGAAINVYILPKNNTKLYSMAVKTMYGYNAAFIVDGGSFESKSFYGLSVGISNELRFGSRKRSGVNLDLLVPIRSSDVEDYYDTLSDNGYETAALTPITISIGYHFEF
ncbi:MAG: hypothetical protein PF485_06920 [Bacteroidales bacterium]|jgi:hypothetical protein|nr:hypothetical protein [Bacteroidales bacterium]